MGYLFRMLCWYGRRLAVPEHSIASANIATMLKRGVHFPAENGIQQGTYMALQSSTVITYQTRGEGWREGKDDGIHSLSLGFTSRRFVGWQGRELTRGRFIWCLVVVRGYETTYEEGAGLPALDFGNCALPFKIIRENKGERIGSSWREAWTARNTERYT